MAVGLLNKYGAPDADRVREERVYRERGGKHQPCCKLQRSVPQISPVAHHLIVHQTRRQVIHHARGDHEV
jgi:hypothetical protein